MWPVCFPSLHFLVFCHTQGGVREPEELRDACWGVVSSHPGQTLAGGRWLGRRLTLLGVFLLWDDMKLGQQHGGGRLAWWIRTQVRHRVRWGCCSATDPWFPAAGVAWDVALTWLGSRPGAASHLENSCVGGMAEGFPTTGTQRGLPPCLWAPWHGSVRAPELATPVGLKVCKTNAPQARGPSHPTSSLVSDWYSQACLGLCQSRATILAQWGHSSRVSPWPLACPSYCQHYKEGKGLGNREERTF